MRRWMLVVALACSFLGLPPTGPLGLRPARGEGGPPASGRDVFLGGDHPFAWRGVSGWRRAAPSALRILDPEAEVGLVNLQANAYLVALADTIPSDGPGVEAALRLATAGRWGRSAPDGRATMEAFGAPVQVDRYRVDEGGRALVFHHTVVRREGTLVQLLAWYPEALGDTGEDEVRAVLGGFRWLDEAEAHAARLEADRRHAAKARAGDGWALRGSTYFDFAYGLRVGLEEGGEARLHAGQEARDRWDGARLVADFPTLGARVVVIPDPGLGLPDVVYHPMAARRLFGGRAGETLRRDVGGARARTSEGLLPGEPATWASLTTLRHRGEAIQVLATGLEAARRGVEVSRDRVLGALELLAPDVLPAQRVGGAWLDRQFGFRLELPAASGKVREVTPPAWQGRGRIVTAWMGDAQVIVAAWAASSDEDADAGVLLGAIEGVIGRPLPATVVEGRGTLAGRPATRIVLAHAEVRLHLLRLERDGLRYVVAQAWDPRSRRAPATLVAPFTLVR